MICLSSRHKEPPAAEVLESVLVKPGPDGDLTEGFSGFYFQVCSSSSSSSLFSILVNNPGVYPHSSRSMWLEHGEGWLLLIPPLPCSVPAQPRPVSSPHPSHGAALIRPSRPGTRLWSPRGPQPSVPALTPPTGGPPMSLMPQLDSVGPAGVLPGHLGKLTSVTAASHYPGPHLQQPHPETPK